MITFDTVETRARAVGAWAFWSLLFTRRAALSRFSKCEREASAAPLIAAEREAISRTFDNLALELQAHPEYATNLPLRGCAIAYQQAAQYVRKRAAGLPTPTKRPT